MSMYKTPWLSYMPTMNNWNFKMSFKIAPKRKYLGINLTKYIQDIDMKTTKY